MLLEMAAANISHDTRLYRPLGLGQTRVVELHKNQVTGQIENFKLHQI